MDKDAQVSTSCTRPSLPYTGQNISELGGPRYQSHLSRGKRRLSRNLRNDIGFVFAKYKTETKNHEGFVLFIESQFITKLLQSYLSKLFHVM